MALLWQLEEYVRVSGMLLKLLLANERRSRIIEKKVRFGRNEQQYILFLFPRKPSTKKKPLIFFLHGGGWGHGQPRMFRFIGRFFARAGYPVALGGYRLAPRHKFPKQLEDAYAGLNAALRLAAQRGLEVDRAVLAGQSAGAQLAALMLLDRVSLRKYQLSQEQFCGLLLISGLLDFWYCQSRKDRRMLRNYLGKPNQWPNADPVRYIQGDETVPVLCLHGEQDPLVDKANSVSFVHKINEKGQKVAELYLVEGSHHADLTSMFLDKLPVTGRMLEWLDGLDRTAGTAE
jgi:acetyl esterase/lipase